MADIDKFCNVGITICMILLAICIIHGCYVGGDDGFRDCNSCGSCSSSSRRDYERERQKKFDERYANEQRMKQQNRERAKRNSENTKNRKSRDTQRNTQQNTNRSRDKNNDWKRDPEYQEFLKWKASQNKSNDFTDTTSCKNSKKVQNTEFDDLAMYDTIKGLEESWNNSSHARNKCNDCYNDDYDNDNDYDNNNDYDDDYNDDDWYDDDWDSSWDSDYDRYRNYRDNRSHKDNDIDMMWRYKNPATNPNYPIQRHVPANPFQKPLF